MGRKPGSVFILNARDEVLFFLPSDVLGPSKYSQKALCSLQLATGYSLANVSFQSREYFACSQLVAASAHF